MNNEFIEKLNQTSVEYYSEYTIMQLFEKEVEKNPDKVAVITENEQITYVMLNRKANQIARQIRALDIRQDEFVGIITEKSVEVIIGLLGILKAGAAYMPIDTDYPVERIRYMLEDSKCKLILNFGKEIHCINNITQINLKDPNTYCNEDTNLENINRPTDLAYLIYTSGTTGIPKGVMIEQRSILRLVKNTNYVDLSNPRILQTGSLAFDASTFEIWGALLNGGTVFIANKNILSDINKFKETIHKYDLNILFITTALFNQFISIDEEVFDDLEQLFFGGEATSEEHVKLLSNRNHKIKFNNIYGPTEVTTFALYYPIMSNDLHTKTPIGKPISNTTVYIMNGNKLCEIGEIGEICIGGPGVARGYLNKEEMTNTKFVENPYVVGERIYRSGDMAKWLEDGNIEFVGRIDDQIKLRGFRIEMGEIEARLKELRVVQDAIVLLKEKNGDKHLVAYVIGEKEVTGGDIKIQLKEKLPEYMIPTYIIRLDEFPLTNNGKVDKKALLEIEVEISVDENYVAPRNEVEARVAEVFKGILGGKTIGIYSDFFELGGDSIKAIRMVSKLREYGYELSVATILGAKTVEGIAFNVKTKSVIEIDQSPVSGEVLLTPIQKQFFNSDLLEPHHFNQSVMFESIERLDSNALRIAFNAIIKHHDMLRTVYRNGKQIVEDIHEGDYVQVEVYDLKNQNQKIAEEFIEAEGNKLQATLSLEVAPLVKPILFRTCEKDYLLVCIHHLIVDGISWRIIAEDLNTGYDMAKRGHIISLPKKTLAFKEWSNELRKYRESKRLKDEINYWKEIEKIIEKSNLNLTADEHLKDMQCRRLSLPADETNKLLYSINSTYNTEINDLLLAALFRAINKLSGKEDLSIYMEGHGREPIGNLLSIDRTVGWFTTIYPLAVQGIGKSIVNDICLTKEAFRKIPNHGIGYTVLKWLGEKVLQGIMPDVTFNYLGHFSQENDGYTIKIHNTDHGLQVSTKNKFGTPIVVDCVVINSELNVIIAYDANKCSKDYAEKLGNEFVDNLKQVINHCMQDNKKVETPSDKGELNWSIEEFNTINNKITQKGYEIERIYPLTPLQEGMLFHKLQNPQSTAYVVQSVFGMDNHFKEEIFKQALTLLADKHEVFRTSIIYNHVSIPRQMLIKGRDIEYTYRNLGVGETLDELLELDMKRGFDLEKDSLIRLMIVRNQDNIYKTVITFHHIIMDGWCIAIFIRDFINLYNEIKNGNSIDSIKGQFGIRTSYEEYISLLQEKDLEAGLTYWEELLSDYDTAVNIRPEGKVDKVSEESRVVEVSLTVEESQKLDAISSKYGITNNTILEAAWGIVLQRYNNVKDVVFGKIVSGRNVELRGLDELVGLFINTIPVRVKLEEEQTFIALAQKLQVQALESGKYDYCSLSDIQKQSALGAELIQVILGYENYYVQEEEDRADFYLDMQSLREQTNYPLSLDIHKSDKLILDLLYDTAVYNEKEVERILNKLKQVLVAVITEPEVRVQDIELLNEDEQKNVLRSFNKFEIEYDRNKTVVEVFEEVVSKYPKQIAVKCKDEALTYLQLNKKANEIGEYLRKVGIGNESIVGLISARTPNLIAGIMGILKAGGAYLPIDSQFPIERIKYMLKDSNAQVLLMVDCDREDIIEIEDIKVIRIEDCIGNQENLPHVTTNNDLAYIIYTSGTTGKPKGVMIENRNLLNLCTYQIQQGQYDVNTQVLQNFNYIFDGSVWEIFPTILAGSTLELVPEGGNSDPEVLIQLIKDKCVIMVPSLFRALLDYAQDNNKVDLLNSFEKLYLGAEVFPVELLEKYKAIQGSHVEDVYNLYGPTECTVCATAFNVSEKRISNTIPIGKPIGNTKLYVMNNNKLCDIGMPGELCIGGEGVSRGYLNRPELTAQKFIINPYNTAEKIYKTGDLVRWMEDGNIEYLGRIDEQVKIKGFRIELGEIENRLRSLEYVDDAIVTVRKEKNESVLCAYLLSKNSLNFNTVKKELGENLPNYMIPTNFMQLEKFPVTRTGKVDKKALPEPTSVGRNKAYIAPSTEMEKCVAEVFSQVLNLEFIGLEDDFFELGGDSIKAIMIVSKLRGEGYTISVKDIMKRRIVKNIARALKINKMEVSQEEVTGEIPLTPIQIDFFNKVGKDKHHFNQSMMLESSVVLNVEYLEKAFSEIIKHHDMLRAVYRDKQRVRAIEEGNLFKLAYYDYTNYIDENELYQVIEQEGNRLQRQFNIADGPLVNIGVFHTATKDYVLICIHHLVIDGVSWRILIEDLTNSYKAIEQGRKVVLPLKTTSFKEWSNQIQEYSSSYQLLKEVEYWKEVETKVAQGRIIATNQENEVGLEQITINLDSKTTQEFLYRINNIYHTKTNDIFLVAVARAVHIQTGQNKVAINMEGHGREQLNKAITIDRTVGWFTSVYPVVIELEKEDIESCIINTKEILRRVPNKGIGYNILKTLGDGILEGNDPDITFNYLGEFNDDTQEELFTISNIPRGQENSDNTKFHTGISVDAMTINKQLQIMISYDKQKYTYEYIKELGKNIEGQISEILTHCQMSNHTIYTASDFGEYNWTYEEFSNVKKKIEEYGYEIQRIYPLTSLQEGMLYHKLMDEQSTEYMVQTTYKVECDLMEDYLKQSLNLLAQKYDVLRTSIIYRGVKQPRQVLLQQREIECKFKDVSGVDNPIKQLREIECQDLQRGFDLEKDSLLRVTIVKVAELDYRIIMNFHHIIMDGWCLSILNNDLSKFYDLIKDGVDISDKDEILVRNQENYESYIRLIEAKNKEEGLQYWRTLLSDYSNNGTILDEGMGEDTKDIDLLSISLTEEQSIKLYEVSSKYGVTVNTIIELAWGIMLQKYNSVEDVVFGKVVSGRNVELEGIEEMVGLFINTIPVRVKSEDNATFAKMAIALQKQAIESSQYDYCSLAEIQNESEMGTKLIQTLFAFENYYIKENVSSHTLQLSIDQVREETNYDITLAAYQKDVLTIELIYLKRKYSLDEMNNVLQYLKTLLTCVIDNFEVRLDEIDIVDDEGRKYLVENFNKGESNYSKEDTVVALFEREAEKNADKIAVKTEINEITYKELNKRANQLAREIRKLGVMPNEFVGIVVDRCVETVIGLLAILKAGAAYMPIDADYPTSRIKYMLEDTKCKVILNSGNTLNDMEEFGVLTEINICTDGFEEDANNIELISQPEDIAYLIYTSGTTGNPKGVMIEQRSINRLVKNTDYVDLSDVAILQTGSLSFDASTFEIWGALLNGGLVYIADKEVLSNVDNVKSVIRENQLNTMFITTALYNQLISIDDEVFDDLTQLYFGGEATSEEHVKLLANRNKAIKFNNIYGPTETTTFALYYPIEEKLRRKTPIGKPISNTTAYILNKNTLCGIGMIGELCIGGPGVARGYLNNKELTSQKFIDNPYVPGERIYRTGDMARWLQDGNIEFIGRKDDQIKLRGFRIEIGEIENRLREIDNIKDAVVIVLNHNSDKQLCAYVITEEDVDIQGIKEELGEKIPNYMIPTYIMPLGSFPMSVNGKINKKELPLPNFMSENTYVAPTNEVERIVVKAFKEVLNIDKVGINDSFFELGGHSLKAIAVINLLEQEAGVRLPIRAIFEKETPKEIAIELGKIEKLDEEEFDFCTLQVIEED